MAELVPADWQRLYGHSIYSLETVIDPVRFRRPVIRRELGRARAHHRARAPRADHASYQGAFKDVLGYPLTPDFRQRLTED